MIAKEFREFKNLLSNRLSKESDQQKLFKTLLGKQIFELTDDSDDHNDLVSMAIEISGVKPGRVVVGDDYGTDLIHNYRSNGSGSFSVSLALYYYFLKCDDTPTRSYSTCVEVLNLFLLGDESFEQHFKWAPTKLPQDNTNEIAMSWTVFLKKYGRFEGIDVVLGEKKVRGRHGLTDIQSDEPLFDGQVELEQGFQFHGAIPFSGASLSFQILEHRTYPFVFSERRLLRKFGSGTLIYPLQENSKNGSFYQEKVDAKEFKYVLILVDARLTHLLEGLSPYLKIGSEIESHALDQFATALSTTAGSVIVRMINIKFEKK